MSDEIELISAEEARRILYAAIQERLGDDWDDETEGWVIVGSHDYMARLTKDDETIDFYVDLLGNVTIDEKNFNSDNGRLLAISFLIASLLIALVLARVAGYL